MKIKSTFRFWRNIEVIGVIGSNNCFFFLIRYIIQNLKMCYPVIIIIINSTKQGTKCMYQVDIIIIGTNRFKI